MPGRGSGKCQAEEGLLRPQKCSTWGSRAGESTGATIQRSQVAGKEEGLLEMSKAKWKAGAGLGDLRSGQ